MTEITPTALITGAAQRIGAIIARTLHQAGMNIIIHYHSSESVASNLCSELNELRPDSARKIPADIRDLTALSALITDAGSAWGRLDYLVNNAAIFFPTPFPQTTPAQWDSLITTNLRAPFFLSQFATPWLRATRGCIVNLIDIYAERPLSNHAVYCISKAGLAMLTKSLAQELSPEIRVNAVAPGAILWPEHQVSDTYKKNLIAHTALQRSGNPEEVARAVLFLIQDAPYTTGHILSVDGGRSIMW